MEFCLDQLRTGLRPGSKLVADLLTRAISLLSSYTIGQIPARCRSATSFEPGCYQDSVMEFGFKPHSRF